MSIAGREVEIVCEEQRVRPEKSEVHKLVCDNRLARTLAGWEPEVSLKEGISMTAEWMKDHAGSYKSGMYTV
jgi:dTDP-glucose 4,6-dehydratase